MTVNDRVFMVMLIGMNLGFQSGCIAWSIVNFLLFLAAAACVNFLFKQGETK